MEETTVTNNEEFTIAVLTGLGELLNTSFDLYQYEIDPDGTIRLSSNEGYCLGITDKVIEVRDIYGDALNDSLSQLEYEQRKVQYAHYAEILNSTLDEQTDPAIRNVMASMVRNQVTLLIGEPKKHVTYKKYRYYETEEQWFQQMTVHDNVLPFECLTDISKIKEAVLKDLKSKWKIR